VTSHNQRSNSFSVICHASFVGLDNGYVKILLPNRIGLLLPIVANHEGIINLHEQIQPKSSNVGANKTPRSHHAGNHAKWNMDHPMHSNIYMMDSDPIESYTLTCKMPRSGKLPRLSYNVRGSCRLDY
jgi:hypothetical protein